jgi:hypothetical protein
MNKRFQELENMTSNELAIHFESLYKKNVPNLYNESYIEVDSIYKYIIIL